MKHRRNKSQDQNCAGATGSCAGKGSARTQEGEASAQPEVSKQGDQDLQPEEESSSKWADERQGQRDRAAEEGGRGKDDLE